MELNILSELLFYLPPPLPRYADFLRPAEILKFFPLGVKQADQVADCKLFRKLCK